MTHRDLETVEWGMDRALSGSVACAVDTVCMGAHAFRGNPALWDRPDASPASRVLRCLAVVTAPTLQGLLISSKNKQDVFAVTGVTSVCISERL